MQTLVIAGLEVNVYSAAPTTTRQGEGKEVVVFFLLHGRYGSAKDVDEAALSVIEQTKERNRELLIVTFDQRNHGKRLVDAKCNDAWLPAKDTSLQLGKGHNIRHSLGKDTIYDMRKSGTARDVSMLIDFLPSFLYPDNNPHPIVEWGVAGISLGGHATWITLAHDERVKTGIPIIGCPDYSKLMALRAQKVGITLEGPYFPKSFKETVERLDPPFLIREGVNPFFGKRVLVLSGEADKVVPWEASKDFVEKLDVGPQGVKTINLCTGVGHECTTEMVNEMARFIADHCL
ncbi:Alpha/Beta hydrolase protein, partial [Lyophyllum atratum]